MSTDDPITLHVPTVKEALIFMNEQHKALKAQLEAAVARAEKAEAEVIQLDESTVAVGEYARVSKERDYYREETFDKAGKLKAATTEAARAHGKWSRVYEECERAEAEAAALRSAYEQLKPCCQHCSHILNEDGGVFACGADECDCTVQHDRARVLFANVRFDAVHAVLTASGPGAEFLGEFKATEARLDEAMTRAEKAESEIVSTLRAEIKDLKEAVETSQHANIVLLRDARHARYYALETFRDACIAAVMRSGVGGAPCIAAIRAVPLPENKP